jgi:hypothetical protein
MVSHERLTYCRPTRTDSIQIFCRLAWAAFLAKFASAVTAGTTPFLFIRTSFWSKAMMLGNVMFAELLAFLSASLETWATKALGNGLRTDMLNPYCLHFDALLALFCSSSGLRQKLQILKWPRTLDQYQVYSHLLDWIWYLELPPVSYCGIPKIIIIYLHSCC